MRSFTSAAEVAADLAPEIANPRSQENSKGNESIKFEVRAAGFFGIWNLECVWSLDFWIWIFREAASHKRDVEIPVAKLFIGARIFVLPSKRLEIRELELCEKPWHGHCNRGGAEPIYLNPSRPNDASH
jgi:hypothetical protein